MSDVAYELVDMGIEHSQYFRGFGTFGTNYDNSCYGIGSNPLEALEDCLEMVAQQDSCSPDETNIVDQLEKQIKADYPDFWDTKKNAAASVEYDKRTKMNRSNCIITLEFVGPQSPDRLRQSIVRCLHEIKQRFKVNSSWPYSIATIARFAYMVSGGASRSR